MIVQMWDGMGMQVTEQIVPLFPFCSYADFPDCYCGAGNGLGQTLVPDYVFGYTRVFPRPFNISIKLSPACWIHDKDWEFALPTWDAFHESNSRLYANTTTIIEKQAKTGVIRIQALRYPELYSQAVDTIGRSIFWRLKQKQGYTIPGSAEWLLKGICLKN